MVAKLISGGWHGKARHREGSALTCLLECWEGFDLYRPKASFLSGCRGSEQRLNVRLFSSEAVARQRPAS